MTDTRPGGGALLLLWAVFALHNWEEARGLAQWAAAEGLAPDWLTPLVYQTAVAGVMVASTLFLLLCWSSPRNTIIRFLLLAFVGALAVNGVAHVLGSALTMSVMPGVLSAVALLLPVSIKILLNWELTRNQWIGLVLAGVLVNAGGAATAVWLARLIVARAVA